MPWKDCLLVDVAAKPSLEDKEAFGFRGEQNSYAAHSKPKVMGMRMQFFDVQPLEVTGQKPCHGLLDFLSLRLGQRQNEGVGLFADDEFTPHGGYQSAMALPRSKASPRASAS